jgi:tRNA-dihydrouridine synthase 1
MVRILAENLKCPVTCKIRCLKNENDTLELVKKIEEAGCSILTVHGRIKEHKKNFIGPANWEIIRKIKTNA